MDTKHAPGPWRIEPWSDQIAQIVDAEGNIFDESFCYSRPEEMANAHLIAAAPTMLTALENVIGSFNDKECNCDGDCVDGRMVGHACFYHRIEEEVKRAIAKARGEK